MIAIGKIFINSTFSTILISEEPNIRYFPQWLVYPHAEIIKKTILNPVQELYILIICMKISQLILG